MNTFPVNWPGPRIWTGQCQNNLYFGVFCSLTISRHAICCLWFNKNVCLWAANVAQFFFYYYCFLKRFIQLPFDLATTHLTVLPYQLHRWCNFPCPFWCSFWISFRLWSTSEFLWGMLKTPLRSSCLSGLHAWCQHSWVYSKACAHKLAADVSIKTARHFPQTYWRFTWFRLRACCSFTAVKFPILLCDFLWLMWDSWCVPVLFLLYIPNYVAERSQDSSLQVSKEQHNSLIYIRLTWQDSIQLPFLFHSLQMSSQVSVNARITCWN